MLLANPKITLGCCIFTYLIPIYRAFNVYRANSKRKDDDLKKKNYPQLGKTMLEFNSDTLRAIVLYSPSGG